jgi:hypothetical protein
MEKIWLARKSDIAQMATNGPLQTDLIASRFLIVNLLWISKFI